MIWLDHSSIDCSSEFFVLKLAYCLYLYSLLWLIFVDLHNQNCIRVVLCHSWCYHSVHTWRSYSYDLTQGTSPTQSCNLQHIIQGQLHVCCFFFNSICYLTIVWLFMCKNTSCSNSWIKFLPAICWLYILGCMCVYLSIYPAIYSHRWQLDRMRAHACN